MSYRLVVLGRTSFPAFERVGNLNYFTWQFRQFVAAGIKHVEIVSTAGSEFEKLKTLSSAFLKTHSDLRIDYRERHPHAGLLGEVLAKDPAANLEPTFIHVFETPFPSFALCKQLSQRLANGVEIAVPENARGATGYPVLVSSERVGRVVMPPAGVAFRCSETDLGLQSDDKKLRVTTSEIEPFLSVADAEGFSKFLGHLAKV